MRFSTTTALAAFFAISSAQFTASGSDPSGNPIGHPELGELMTAGQPFTITWTPTTQGKPHIFTHYTNHTNTKSQTTSP
jgi:hypothetical protein